MQEGQLRCQYGVIASALRPQETITEVRSEGLLDSGLRRNDKVQAERPFLSRRIPSGVSLNTSPLSHVPAQCSLHHFKCCLSAYSDPVIPAQAGIQKRSVAATYYSIW